LRELSNLIEVRIACQHLFFESLSKRFEGIYRRLMLKAATAQNIKTSERLKIEARSSKLLIPFGLRLGICCSGLGLVRSAYSSYTAFKRLDCAPACHHHLLEVSKQAPARSFVQLT
jgi:hypothetical protein